MRQVNSAELPPLLARPPELPEELPDEPPDEAVVAPPLPSCEDSINGIYADAEGEFASCASSFKFIVEAFAEFLSSSLIARWIAEDDIPPSAGF